MFALPLTVAFLSGCAHVAPRVDPEALPVLPPPRGDLYARAPGRPEDPVVASVVADLGWDQALSGAAAAVALAELAGERVDLCRLRWMAVLAGYPYPLSSRSSAVVAEGTLPEALITEAQGLAGRAVDIGLVRARGGALDRWELLVSERRGEFPPLAREAAVGDRLALGEGEWVVSDPLGHVRPAEASLRVDLPGEWLVSARSGGRSIATVPIYVGVDVPVLPAVRCDVSGPRTAEGIGDWVAGLRTVYGYDALEHDPALDSVARARLRDLVAGAPLPAVAGQLRVAGYVNVPVAGAECRAVTIAACLENIWWSPEKRGALIGDLVVYGVAFVDTGSQVSLVLVGAG